MEMIGKAFCPAHVTGFFRADMAESPNATGSVGAGFSIRVGVTTTVRTSKGTGIGGTGSGTARWVAEEFLKVTDNEGRHVDIRHEMGVPAGYGLGSSGALALSTAYALDRALGTGMGSESLGQMAHRAEIHHRSGLGDVLASYYGGFEIRTRGGAPGYGELERVDVGNPSVFVVCLSPYSTKAFLEQKMGMINGIGGRMVEEMLRRRDVALFQRMSMEFARKSGVMTPTMEEVAARLAGAGADCGVAMLGGTIFTMVPPEDEEKVAGVLRGYRVIRTRLDMEGARVLR